MPIASAVQYVTPTSHDIATADALTPGMTSPTAVSALPTSPTVSALLAVEATDSAGNAAGTVTADELMGCRELFWRRRPRRQPPFPAARAAGRAHRPRPP